MANQTLLPLHQQIIRDRIGELGLGDFRSAILKSAYSAYDLIGVKQSKTRAKGTTRFGGQPDLPSTFQTSDLDSLQFLFQVNLSDLPDGSMLGLPSDGILSTFSERDPYYGGKTFFFPSADLVRYRMPDPAPDYIFSNVKPWKLKIATSVGFAQYGDELFYEIEEAGLADEYEQLCNTEFSSRSGPCFGEILGRFSDLNGDMRETAADGCGGKPNEWLSLWKLFSSTESNLVISDFHLLHGMIRKRHLKNLDFTKMFTTEDNG